LGQRSRKRGRRDAPATGGREAPATALETAAPPATAEAPKPMRRSRSEERNAAVRATLKPYGSGERPWAIRISIACAALLGAQQLFGDCFAVAFVIQALTLRQTVLPRELLGRANAAMHVATLGVLPVTALVAGWLAQQIGVRDAMWVGVIGRSDCEIQRSGFPPAPRPTLPSNCIRIR